MRNLGKYNYIIDYIISIRVSAIKILFNISQTFIIKYLTEYTLYWRLKFICINSIISSLL